MAITMGFSPRLGYNLQQLWSYLHSSSTTSLGRRNGPFFSVADHKGFSMVVQETSMVARYQSDPTHFQWLCCVFFLYVPNGTAFLPSKAFSHFWGPEIMGPQKSAWPPTTWISKADFSPAHQMESVPNKLIINHMVKIKALLMWRSRPYMIWWCINMARWYITIHSIHSRPSHQSCMYAKIHQPILIKTGAGMPKFNRWIYSSYYPLIIWHSHGKYQCWIGKWSTHDVLFPAFWIAGG